MPTQNHGEPHGIPIYPIFYLLKGDYMTAYEGVFGPINLGVLSGACPEDPMM